MFQIIICFYILWAIHIFHNSETYYYFLNVQWLAFHRIAVSLEKTTVLLHSVAVLNAQRPSAWTFSQETAQILSSKLLVREIHSSCHLFFLGLKLIKWCLPKRQTLYSRSNTSLHRLVHGCTQKHCLVKWLFTSWVRYRYSH